MKQGSDTVRGQWMKKLRSRSGESIGETLVALLISVLALLILAGAISTASKLLDKTDRVMSLYYTGKYGAETQGDGLVGLGGPARNGLVVSVEVVKKAPGDDSFAEGEKLIRLVGGNDSTPVYYACNSAFSARPVYSYSFHAQSGG